MRRIPTKRRGFTLLELLVVVTIIGIIVAFIVTAAMDGIRRAEERQTQALIVKLEQAMSDRVDALMQTTAPVNRTHKFLGAIHFPSALGNPAMIPSPERAQVIARIDMIRAEIPEIWYPLATPVIGSQQGAKASYVVGYGGNFYPSGAPSRATNADAYILPLGNRVDPSPYGGSDASLADGATVIPSFIPPLQGNTVDGTSGYPNDPNYDADGTGILGASYGAAAGIAKNLGALPTGFDGVDNNHNSYTDEFEEWFVTSGDNTHSTILSHIASHDPKTARSEMLYALLVEGQGALGSIFTADSFTDKEVRDTDGDGLPEFIDAWGEPLQFFRWPIYYIDSDLSPVENGLLNNQTLFQRGFLSYNTNDQLRQQNPLDPSQTLVAPAWWANLVNQAVFYPATANALSASSCAVEFQNQFFSLTDPNWVAGSGSGSWDRTGATARRAYFSKYLIISSGPDKTLGIDISPLPTAIADVTHLNRISNQAAQASIYQDFSTNLNRSGTFSEFIINKPSSTTSGTLSTPDSSKFWSASIDDISNHNLSGPGSGVR